MITHGWATPDLEARIAHHIRAWERVKQAKESHPVGTLPFVTINRDFGCEALRVAQILAALLNENLHPPVPWVAYDRELLDRVASEMHLRRDIVNAMDGARRDEMTELFDQLLNRKVTDTAMAQKLAEVVRSLAVHGHAVLVGRGSHLITKGLRNGLHVRLTASRQWRVNRVALACNVSTSSAERIVVEGEKERQHFLRTFFIYDPERPFLHDLTINVSRFSPNEVAEIVATAVKTPRFSESQRALDDSRHFAMAG
jgi:cytidylate kinase